MSVNERNVPVIILIAVLAAIIGFAAIAGLLGFGMMGGWSGWGMGGMMGFGWIFMAIPAVAVVLLLIALTGGCGRSIYRPSCCHGEEDAGEKNALDVLEMRYARGEISRDEYLKMMDDLKRR